MLAEYQQRRSSCSLVDDPQVYFVLNAYVDVLLTIRAELVGPARRQAGSGKMSAS